MTSALERIQAYRNKKKEEQKNIIKKFTSSNMSALERIKKYRKENPYKTSNKETTKEEKKNTPVNWDKIREEQNKVLSTPVNVKNTLIKESKNELPTNYILPTQSKIPTNYNQNVIEEANKNVIRYTGGNPLQTIGSTALSGLTQLGKGVVDFSESLLDTGLQLGTSKINPYYWFNPEKLESHRQLAQELIGKDASEKFINETLGYGKTLSSGKTVQETLDENSLIKSDKLSGQIFRSVGNQLPSLMASLGTGAVGQLPFATNAYGSALEQAYSEGATRQEANVYAFATAGAELLTEKIYGGIGSVLGKGAIDDVVKNEITKRISNSVLKKLTEVGIGAIAEGGEEVISDIINPILQKLSYKSEEELKELYKDTNLWDTFVQGALSSVVLGGVQTIGLNSQNKGNIVTVEEIIDNVPQQQEISVEEAVEQENKTSMQDLPNAMYQFTKTENENINKLNESMSKYFDNSQKTKDLANTITKIIEDKDYSVVFDDTLTNKSGNLVNAQISTKNGKTEIKINPNSPRAVEFLMVHEITHAIENDSMKNLVLDYAKKDANFNQALENLKQTYGVDDVSSEVLADISGQLFGNQEFINNLSTQKPNIFKQIYNKIVEIANKITGNSNEALFIRDLKQKWENAYRTSEQIKQGTTYSQQQFDVSGNENLDDASKVFFNKRDNGSIYVQALNNNNKILYDFLFAGEKDIKRTLGNELGQYIFDNVEAGAMQDVSITSNNTNSETDYFMSHRPTETGAYASDISNNGELMPNDVYQHPEWYFMMNEDYSKESFNALKKIKGNPNAEITIYRATTGDKINVGDWVTLSKKYAEYHNNSQFDGKGNIVELKVKAKDVQFAGDDINEFGYYPNMEKYSQDSKTWQQYLENEFKATGTRTYTKDILPTKEETKVNLPIKEARTLDKVQKNNYVESKISKMLNSQSYKVVNKASKTGQNYLYFNNAQKRNFKEKLMKYVGKTSEQLTNAKTWNEVKELVKEYANKDYIYVDEELKSVKNQVRNMSIKVTDDLKKQITDYNDFRKENFGKLKLGNNGNTIDSVYQELSEQYPYYFGSAETQADMLYELSDFMNKDINIVEKYQFDDAYLEETTAKIFNNLMQNTLNEQQIDELRTNLEDKLNARTREVIQAELMNEMGITLDDISKGNDISSFDLSRTDPIRVNEKIFGAKVGDKINNATIRKTQENEADRIRFLNKERNEIKELGIKAFSKESEAVQKYGEKQYINDKGDIVPYGYKELAQDFPDVKTQEKIKKASEFIRNKYDTYIDQINNVLVDMGYDAIKKRKDYMRHFQALNDVFSRFGVPLNAESLQSDSLPTDINGLTDQFKPGKQYFASAMQRIGMKTAYDAITGIDGYLEGASNLIYHTEDIQRYRALSKFIRNTYGAEHGFENVDNLSLQQQEQRIEDIQSNKLAKYVSWLDEQANALANKKGKIDRGVEEVFGRRVYKILETAKKQVGSNMVGFNVRSALTNFASVVQGASKTNKVAFLKGTISSINNIIHKDNLVDKSDFLTRRFGSDQLSQKLWQKATNAGFALMTGTDYFTANQIWRSKYYEYLDKGFSENMAIKGADDFASRIMGDRSKGSTATLFNSKTLGFFTQFQLEVNNQWSSLIHDNKMDLQKGNKTASSIVFQLGQLFAMSYMFNNLMKSLTGSDVMIDPIELLKMLFNPDDEEEDIEQRATKVLGEVVNNIPFASVLTGGRIPIGEAFGGLSTGFKYATGQTDEYGNKYEISDVTDDMIESAFYWILPTGFSQLNKTRKGLSMYDENLPVKGSYTESGNLRFTADKSLGGKVKATLFGQYSSKESQDYIESGFKTIPKGKINEMKSLGMNSTEYREYRKGLSNAGKTNEEKLNYINGLNLPIDKKNIMANNVIDSDKYKIDMSKYDDFSSYEEMQMYYTQPQKYSTITQITTYQKYNSYKNEIDTIKDKYDNTNERKYAVISYVNNLNLSIPQKAMLIKMNYSSFKDYDNQIIEYINSQDLTIQEKTDILTELGFTVKDGKVY